MPRSFSNQISTSTTTTPPFPAKTTTTPPLLASPPQPTHLPITRLSPEALQKRRVKGLCFRCPAKYSPGHKCAPPQFMMIVDNEDDPTTEPLPEEVEPIPTIDMPPAQLFSLSIAVFYGLASPQALRVYRAVTILVDTGSTHNIIQPRIITALNIPHLEIPPFPVTVGNGEKNPMSRLIPRRSHLPPKNQVAGADVILGLVWLSTLGPILADFSISKLIFQVGAISVTLTGEPIFHVASPTSVHSLMHKHSVASLHALYFNFEPNNPEPQ
ncbi:hypothetical protein OSB04_003799 [Centaurea solstitialis]|uniref:Uncharacterized protein n=1 Tax=Centaurea solstitialis TaxID=347529 RepID=A0AA38UD11_9ASTR|nr:hypothetical protein OSB04_003799 [Centaurea solstitialis]